MNEWQPIKTAPKDGTPILIFEPSPYLKKGWIDVVQNFYEIEYKSDADKWYARDSAEISCDNPTHWQPLPDPPKE
jgi:hypothetical protein